MTDIEIANAATLRPVTEIAEKIGVDPEVLELYGKYKAKMPLKLINEDKIKDSKLILVTAISPTPAGEGKTTVSIGMSQGMNKIGLTTTVVLREPSLGPVFGIKGGAAGGGYSQVLPMEDINLHFTGDFSAIEKAHNLLAALIDNNIQSKSRTLNIDPRTVAWKRVMDMNDRSLRKIVVGLGGLGQGIPREAGFDITAASEIMAILCLSKDLEDLKERIGNIFVGFTFDKNPIYARDLNAQGAMTLLLKDAIKPNLVQTIEGTPAIIHGGPFANIAQGTNTVVATKMGLSTAPYVVTEAGFGADLGAEKFLDIKCVDAGLKPDAVVIVATIKALKYHGGKSLDTLKDADSDAVHQGLPNLEKHIENIQSFGLPVLVTVNKYTTDSEDEIKTVRSFCESKGVRFEVCDVWGEGGNGATALAKELGEILEVEQSNFTPLYQRSDSPEQKIEKLCKNYYGADQVEYSAQAQKDLKRIKNLGLNDLPICMAKTQSSISDDAKLLGRPEGLDFHIREIEIAAGAGFIIPIAGSMMRMPGLPATPAAEGMDIDKDGNITGLS